MSVSAIILLLLSPFKKAMRNHTLLYGYSKYKGPHFMLALNSNKIYSHCSAMWVLLTFLLFNTLTNVKFCASCKCFCPMCCEIWCWNCELLNCESKCWNTFICQDKLQCSFSMQGTNITENKLPLLCKSTEHSIHTDISCKISSL